uniref:7TM_GPCR_Srx domain-containing protein n=1 Tax=Strongyloides papillosus TaxID=174720 RepID=A0A0N5CBP7_STREA
MDYVAYTITISTFVIGIIANITAICAIVHYPEEKKNKHFGILLLVQFIAGLLTSIFQFFARYYLVCKQSFLNLKQGFLIFILTTTPCLSVSLFVWFFIDKDIPKNILSYWIKKNNISLIGISESTEAIAFDIVSFFSYKIHPTF